MNIAAGVLLLLAAVGAIVSPLWYAYLGCAVAIGLITLGHPVGGIGAFIAWLVCMYAALSRAALTFDQDEE